MLFFDYHTHSNKAHSCKSCTLAEMQQITAMLDEQKISLQFHPWDLPPHYEGLPQEFIEAAKSDKIYAIGEIGLDRLKGPVLTVQKAYFIDLLKLADELHKPVILHVVRYADEVLHLLDDFPALPKIWHGFRGKKELLARLLKANIFISLHRSMLDNDEIMNYIKKHAEYHDLIGFESDDSDIDIAELYKIFKEKIYG